MNRGDYVKVDIGMGLYAYGIATTNYENSKFVRIDFLDGSDYQATLSECSVLTEKELFTVKLSQDKKIHEA